MKEMALRPVIQIAAVFEPIVLRPSKLPKYNPSRRGLPARLMSFGDLFRSLLEIVIHLDDDLAPGVYSSPQMWHDTATFPSSQFADAAPGARDTLGRLPRVIGDASLRESLRTTVERLHHGLCSLDE